MKKLKMMMTLMMCSVMTIVTTKIKLAQTER